MQPAFRYVHLDTPVHRLHPLVKLIYVFLTLVLVMYPIRPTDLPVLLIWLGLSALLWIVGRIELRRFATLLKILFGTFVFLIIIQGFTYRFGQTPLLVLGHLRLWEADLGVITKEGVWFGVVLSVRILTAASALPIFVMTTPTSAIMTALGKLGVPRVATFMFVSALSFTSLLFEMWGSIVEAQKLRAFDIDRMNIFRRAFKAYIPIITPLILLLFRKANDFQIAMETKGFGSPIPPTEIEVLQTRPADYLWLAFILAVFAACTVLKFA
ncbi:MAG: energy-coupling factor transporter transmembrane component T [Anaerolineae bacterium]|nr:energy-coupling factor transporter transmembrane protein EcfT [Anaerolineae bacterium]MCX8067234.1 energy-coupling factor transporter transmembrane protein EcfT [Anaerolineae bacterium]MDW7992845.1 energy-coupling factor transporter transmembrane component T [Anaerolineae bacterium]